MDEKFQKDLQHAYETRAQLNRFKPPKEIKSHLDSIRAELLNTTVPNTSPPQLIVRTQKKSYRYELTQSITIGADKSNSLQLDSDYISAQHCILKKDEDSWFVQDLASNNGIYVNEIKTDMKYLKDGDIIQIADVKLIFFR